MIRRKLAAAAFLLPLLFAGSVPAQAQDPSRLSVQIDSIQRVQLGGAVSAVIVGNPAIADVTVVDQNTLFVTGKGYGVTEVVAVDAIGRTIFQRQIVVTGGSSGSVRMWRGARATEMACAGSCETTIRSSGGTSSSQTP
ncbi:MAG: pilus assembly protein CpaC [Alphaproteobacteria bacterium]|nr:MAG: pilus assembly protein CpaC [Alphaproteobacteria bacterium]PZO38546.1 MAG: pilus assembly protein CpaC [Alphaproteobacteria bacterium]